VGVNRQAAELDSHVGQVVDIEQTGIVSLVPLEGICEEPYLFSLGVEFETPILIVLG
jgi:hypothetical protein